MQLNAQIHHINYDKLCAGLLKQKKTSKLKVWLTGKKSAVKLSLKRPALLKPLISDLAKEYGISLNILRIGNDVLIHSKTGDRTMLTISVTIENIDYDKLADAICASMNKTDSNGKAGAIQEVAGIVKPFVNKTMETIPPAAIAELLNLLAKEKLATVAERYGITVSAVSIG